MVGMDKITGKRIEGTEHLTQSLAILFTTQKGERVMRRHLGVEPELIDLPASPNSLGLWAYGLASALDDANENRFELSQVHLQSVDLNGKVVISFNGENHEKTETLQSVIKFL